MKVLFFSDVHLAERPPLARAPSYADDLFAKLEEIRELAGTCDVTICGGDWLHWPRPPQTSHRLVRRLIELLQGWPHPLLSAIGNHDSSEAANIERQPLGVVQQAFARGPVRFLRGDYYVDGPGPSAQVSAAHWQPDIDDRPDLYRVQRIPGVDFVLKVSHGMVMPRGEYPYRCVQMDAVETEADIVLLGHMHWQTWPPRKNPTGTWFVGPGSVGRTSRQDAHEPSVLTLELDKGRNELQSWQDLNMKLVPLKSARPASEVFSWSQDSSREEAAEMFVGYVEALEAGINVEGLTIEEAIASVQDQVPDGIMKMAREYLEKAGL